jgi:hypothetical protein
MQGTELCPDVGHRELFEINEWQEKKVQQAAAKARFHARKFTVYILTHSISHFSNSKTRFGSSIFLLGVPVGSCIPYFIHMNEACQS